MFSRHRLASPLLASLKQWKPHKSIDGGIKLSEHSGKERPKPKKAIFKGGDDASRGFIMQPRYGRKIVDMLLEENGTAELLRGKVHAGGQHGRK
ncbi:hypothetical protein FOZ62_025987 [Perkinsus olseni]|uniref:Uncharacterized protein n=1 Tax=Perkinsus olseni TaxID=32597 RepID=A0A7J6QNU7_PEROL|nr:hypothetical protein FOZ62_025987 [Perkinsus olseni]